MALGSSHSVVAISKYLLSLSTWCCAWKDTNYFLLFVLAPAWLHCMLSWSKYWWHRLYLLSHCWLTKDSLVQKNLKNASDKAVTYNGVHVFYSAFKVYTLGCISCIYQWPTKSHQQNLCLMTQKKPCIHKIFKKLPDGNLKKIAMRTLKTLFFTNSKSSSIVTLSGRCPELVGAGLSLGIDPSWKYLADQQGLSCQDDSQISIDRALWL